MKRITVIGLFCEGMEVSDGQSIKTRIVTEEIEKNLGKEQVARVDTYGWKKNPVRLLMNCFLAVRNSTNVMFLTDEGGIKVFPWLLLLVNTLYRRSLHYVVIGGWLVPFLGKHPFLKACLKKLDHIFAETKEMQKGLERLEFSNVSLLPNFKNLTPLREEKLDDTYSEPYSLCTFSRVMKEKGIEDAVAAVIAVNARYGRTVYTLDIYGCVDPGQQEWFADLSSNFPREIRYCGIVPYEKSVETLKDYFALLFPTHFVTEGIPGTIIDAYAAGIPVIAPNWNNFGDIIDDGFTGIGYPWMKNEMLESILEEIVREPNRILNMKKNCLKKVQDYLPENAMAIILEKLS